MDFSKVFKGILRNGYYFVEQCPFCYEKFSLRFMAGFSIYECISCHETGTDKDFMKKLEDHPLYDNLLSQLTVDSKAPEGLVDLGAYYPTKECGVLVPSGFSELDKLTGGFRGGELTILTGKRAEGKSTIAGQIALNSLHTGNKPFVYSGELSARSFQNWIFLQAAGRKYLEPYTDSFGVKRYRVDKEYAEPHIRHWLQGRFILYDNKVIKSSESNTILERATVAQNQYGCSLFIIDNLKTARFKKDSERDYLRKQANFAADMLAFANQYGCHVILIAHPKKEDTGDSNDNVSGLSDITDLASNVIRISRASEEERREYRCDSILELSKNREHGDNAKIKLVFDASSKRFMQYGENSIIRYGWEDDV